MKPLAPFLLLLACATSPVFADQWLFDLKPHQIISNPIQIRQPGPVVVSAQWQGDPLTVVLTPPGGNKSYKTLKTSSDKLEVTATTDDVKKGTQWTVEVYLWLAKSEPPPAGSPAPQDPNANRHAQGTLYAPFPVAFLKTPAAGNMPPPQTRLPLGGKLPPPK